MKCPRTRQPIAQKEPRSGKGPKLNAQQRRKVNVRRGYDIYSEDDEQEDLPPRRQIRPLLSLEETFQSSKVSKTSVVRVQRKPLVKKKDGRKDPNENARQRKQDTPARRPPGTAALLEIRREQKKTNFCIRKTTFAR